MGANASNGASGDAAAGGLGAKRQRAPKIASYGLLTAAPPAGARATTAAKVVAGGGGGARGTEAGVDHSDGDAECQKLEGELVHLISEHPYLEPGKAVQVHPLSRWVTLCRDALADRKPEQAKEHLNRVKVGIRAEMKPIHEAFRRFDIDNSNQLDATEFRHMCAYLGWGDEEAGSMDFDGDGKVSLQEFVTFVGVFGGIQQLFEQRRLRISSSRKDVCDFAGIAVGSRVQAHFYINGQKSKFWREAAVLAVGVERSPFGVEGPKTVGVKLEFGFATDGEEATWRAQQVVPPHWVISGVEDASTASALREVGILDGEQSFWQLVLPEPEMKALQRLEGCQRGALSLVRRQASDSHEQAMPSLEQRFKQLGWGPSEVQTTLDWIRELAPIVVHVNLDSMGQYLEVDDYYRSQFETKASFGAGDGDAENSTRRHWEHDLFAGHYDDAKDFDRCKYGALNVMNDYRGVVTANQYGDSYLVLKDVRLRCTFASEDSGGIEVSRLAVLDKYAHVLDEYSDQELKDLVAIAIAAISPDREALSAAGAGSGYQVLRGSSQDPMVEWITMGFPRLSMVSGRFYFEVQLMEDTGAPQVGILSSKFQRLPNTYSQEGVGDDEHGWAVDVLNAIIWHNGTSHAWAKAAPSKERTITVEGAYPWIRVQQQERVLAEDTVVGVGVDLDRGEIWFSCDGHWTKAPSIHFPPGTEVFPAVSFKGRGSFNFGPQFKYQQPDHYGRFSKWSGLASKVRVDCPHLGDEETLDCYKEVQIHGEVNLKRNVQRLVAASKYRNKPKSERSLALRVLGAGVCDGTYNRAGAHDGMPLYHGSSGGCMFYDAASRLWCINDRQDTKQWRFSVPTPAREDPPRQGWSMKDRDTGSVDATSFKEAALEAGLSDELVAKIVEALGDTDSGHHYVYQKKGENTITRQWAKATELMEAPKKADEVWQQALERTQEKLKASHGLQDATIIESKHPYEVRENWSKEVRFEGETAVQFVFASQSRTYDKQSKLRIYSGGLSRTSAGPGARVEVTTSDGATVWATVVAREDGGWRLSLDRRPIEAVEQADQDGDDDALGIPRWPQVGDAVESRSLHNPGWFRAIVVDIAAEVDWYSATRKAMYTLEWDDGDKRDQEKSWEQLRRPSGAVEADTHHFLEEVALYSAVVPPGRQCFATFAEEDPDFTSVDYGDTCEMDSDTDDDSGYDSDEWEEADQGPDSDPFANVSMSRKFTFVFLDKDGVTHTVILERREVTWGVDSSRVETGKRIGIECLGDGEFRLFGPGGVVAQVASPDDDRARKVMVWTEAASRRGIGVELIGPDVQEFKRDLDALKREFSQAEADDGGFKVVGQEISRFELDLSSPLSPVRVEDFTERLGGPAQKAGVKVGWYLDIFPSLESSAEFRSLIKPLTRTAVPSVSPAEMAEEMDEDPMCLFEAALKQPEELLEILNGPLLHSRNISLSFADSASRNKVKLLPEAYARFDGSTRVSSEIKLFEVVARQVRVEAFLRRGPAQIAGVRTDWVLDISKTLRMNPIIAKRNLTRESILENPNVLLSLSDVTLVFKQPNPGRVERAQFPSSAGAAGDDAPEHTPWKRVEISGDTVELTFRSDADSSGDAKERWGVLAIALPAGAKVPSQSQIDKFAASWVEAMNRSRWVASPEVLRDEWDEARLKALCKKHGWDFEWMTEDGERVRRAREVAGLENANAIVTEAKKAAIKNQPSSKTVGLPDGADGIVSGLISSVSAKLLGQASS